DRDRLVARGRCDGADRVRAAAAVGVSGPVVLASVGWAAEGASSAAAPGASAPPDAVPLLGGVPLRAAEPDGGYPFGSVPAEPFPSSSARGPLVRVSPARLGGRPLAA